jgi:hypothetical protein
MREAAAERVRATSLRKTATEIGLTPTGLQYFLDGSDPQEGTRRKLSSWYLWSQMGLADRDTGDPEWAALTILSRTLPPAHQAEVIEDVVRRFADAHAAAGVPQPEWIARVQVLLRAEGP